MNNRAAVLMVLTFGLMLTCTGILLPGAVRAQGPQLKMISIDAASPGQINQLARMGIDIAAVRKGPVRAGPRNIAAATYRVEAVVSAADEKKIAGAGFTWMDKPGKGPEKKIGQPYVVYQSFDAPVTGIQAQLQKLAATFSHLAQLKSIGKSINHRQLLVMRLTNEKIKGDKPKVFIMATHHAREWVGTEMAMRLIKYLTTNYGVDARVTDLLDTTEIFILPVANPDGYQYTFTTERLWRKNLRDNDDDGEITVADGVDLNRNWDHRWGYNDEGSSANIADATYRGPSPFSEPENRAIRDFIVGQEFSFILSYHTYSNLILYPWGWQVKTPSWDDPIFVAQAGVDGNSAIWDSLLGSEYNPGVAADLYTTNGEFTDWCYGVAGVPSYTVELTDGYDFRFPDDEAMVQQVFEDNLEFALSLAESALDPGHPRSPVGIAAGDVYHTPVTQSTGPEQLVEILARKDASPQLVYTINGGTEMTAEFEEVLGADYNAKSGVYFSNYRAIISGQQAGDIIRYRIENGAVAALGPYSYDVLSATGNPILLLTTDANYLDYYTQALDAYGYSYDVWDVLDRGVPSNLEVFSHYEVVTWFTGDEYATDVPGWGYSALEAQMLGLRDFMNYEDGRVFATGQDLGWLAVYYGMFPDDFFQYRLGAYVHLEEGGMAASGLPYDVVGEDGDPIFDGFHFSLSGGSGAGNQQYADTFLLTSSFLPHFENSIAARYYRPGGPFSPYSGDYYVYSQMADSSYKSLGGTFTVPEGAPTLSFWISYDIEEDWDFAFVEITEAGTDNWTTLPDLNGLTTTSTGDSCTSGWVEEIHPFLAHYMDEACNLSGTTGEWNAFTGSSSGWQLVEMDLSAYAGMTVELYVSYASDWATQNLGVFVDDIAFPGMPIEDFEAGLGVFQVGVAPGSTALNNWERISGVGFPEGPAIRSPNSLYLGFGFEAIDTENNRSDLMHRIMSYFGQ